MHGYQRGLFVDIVPLFCANPPDPPSPEPGFQGARTRIARVLEDAGIVVRGDEEPGHPVPELDAEPEILVGVEEGTPLTVEDAFFFRYM